MTNVIINVLGTENAMYGNVQKLNDKNHDMHVKFQIVQNVRNLNLITGVSEVMLILNHLDFTFSQ